MTTSPFTQVDGITNRSRRTFWIAPALLFLIACASPPPVKKTTVEIENPTNDLVTAQQKILKLEQQVQDLESRLTALNDKINLKVNGDPEAKIIQPPVAATKSVPKAENEAISQDEAADRFREAKILFDSERYSDSIIEFSEFTKAFPHHAFAAASQYYLGMAYFKQNEFKLAEEEWSRELISYPHSQFTADTLKGLREVSEQLKKPEKVTYFEQRLLMLFPNSPQAKGISETKVNPKATHSNETTPPITTPNPAEPVVEESDAHP